MKANDKTNVMRVLDQKKIQYEAHAYEPDATMTGEEIAAILGEVPEHVFKTLVTQGKTNTYYVFVIPVKEELDLKKAALAVGEKSVEMLKQKDLFGLTGYVHGGCSPLGMKKVFTTVIDISAKDQPIIIFSAGKIGYQIETTLVDLSKVLKYSLSQITL